MKPLSEYYARKGATDGFRSECKSCLKALNRGRDKVYRQANREKIKQKSAKYYLANKDRILEQSRRWHRENADRKRILSKRWGAANAEHKRQYDLQWKSDNAEHIKARNARWQRDNPVKVRLSAARDRARKAGVAIVDFSEAQLADKFSYWGGRCWACPEEATEMDHVKPISKGGAHMLSNIRPICRPCNKSKSGRWPLVAWKGRGK